jgi:hypothetical protein
LRTIPSTVKSAILHWTAWIFAGLLAATPMSAHARPPAAEEIVTMPIHVGIGGAFKVGQWTPVQVNLGPSSAGSARLEVDAPDPDGSVVTYQGEPVALTRTGPNPLALLIKVGRLEAALRVREIGRAHV